MNILFRIFVVLGLLVVVALFGALLAPYFIKWEDFTTSFEREASKLIGQSVQVGGDTNLRILPLPFLEFSDVQVGANADGSAVMTVDQFSIRAELFPLLSGEVRIVEMNMDQPKLNVQVAQDGTISWIGRSNTSLNVEQINIEKLTVAGGEVVVSGLAGGREIRLGAIDADISARSLKGPWRIDAKADVQGEPTNLKVLTGVYQADNSMRIKVEAEQKLNPFAMSFDGPVSFNENVPEWRGDFKIKPFNEEQLGEFEVTDVPLPIELEGLFVARPERISVPEYRMEIGDQSDPYTVIGKGDLEIADTIFFRAQADGRQIDLDEIQKVQSEQGQLLENRIAAIRSILERVPVPAIEGELDIILPALVAGDTYIRDVKAVIRPLGKGWDMRSFSAKFPGNTTLEAQGRLGLRNDFGFDGDFVLASRQPSGFASWVSGDVNPAFRRLKNFGIASKISISQRQTTFENLELRMDDAVLKGRMTRLASTKTRPAILLKLQGNRVNIENLQAIYSLVQRPNAKDDVTHDLDIDVQAGVLEAMVGDEDVVAKGVAAKVKIRDGLVTVDQLNAEDFYGSKIVSSGRIENLLTSPNGNMKFSLTSENLAPLLRFSKKYTGPNRLVEPLLVASDLTQNVTLDLELDSSANDKGSKGRFLANGHIAGTDLNLRVGFSGQLSDLENLDLSVTSTLKNETPAVLMRQSGIDTLPTNILEEASGSLAPLGPPGPMTFQLDMAGKPSGQLDTQISIQLPDTNLSASGTVSSKDWLNIDTQFSATLGSGNIAPYAILAGVKAPGLRSDDTLPVSLSIDVNSTQEKTLFDNIEGQISGNDFSGNLALIRQIGARPKLAGKMTLEAVDLELFAESAFGRDNTLIGNIAGELGLDQRSQNFASAIYKGLDSDIKITADQMRISDELSGKSGTLQLIMLDGSVELRDISLGLLGGQLDGNVAFKNTEGTIIANARYVLVDGNAERVLKLAGFSNFVSGEVTSQGSLEASGKSVEALIANLSGNGLITMKKFDVAGFNPAGFDQVLLETGVDGYEIQSVEIQDLVEQSLLVSSMSLKEIEAPYSVTRGELRMRNISGNVALADMAGDMRYDFKNEGVKASLNVTFDPGRRDTIQGTEPQIELVYSGAADNIERDIVTERLESYLALRAFEQSQRRIETLEAEVLETQRLQQQIALNFAKEQEAQRKRLEEERLAAEEAARLEAELKAAEEAARLEAERKAAEEVARLEAERKAAEEAARLEAERKAAEEAARLEAERKAAEEAARLEAERKAAEEAARLEAKRKAAEEAARLEAERKAAEEAARLEAERKAAENAARLKAERDASAKPLRTNENNSNVPDATFREKLFNQLEDFLQTN